LVIGDWWIGGLVKWILSRELCFAAPGFFIHQFSCFMMPKIAGVRFSGKVIASQ